MKATKIELNKNLNTEIFHIDYEDIKDNKIDESIRIKCRNVFNKPGVVVVDNIFPHERRLGDKILNKYFINSVHGFITMSKQVLSDLRYFDNLKPAINAVHPLYDNFGDIQSKLQARNNLNLNQEDNYVLFFGIIRKYKGLVSFSAKSTIDLGSGPFESFFFKRFGFACILVES